jgi:uncharacterized protein YdaU (DUF1376 family)
LQQQEGRALMEMPINDRVMIGSNSLAYEQALRQDIEIVLCDDHEKLFHFAKWHIEDYIQGTEGMQLEIEGAYIRFLMRLYRRGKPLPDDDRFMSIAMGLSLRVWKRIKDSLISIGKIICRAGYLTNPRFEKERRERAEQLRKQAEGAHKRWEEHRKKEAAQREVSANFAGSLPEISAKLPANEAEKPNEINETAHSQPYILNIDIEKDKNPPTPQGGSAPAKARRSRSAVPEVYSDNFEKFWEVYPLKKGKGVASQSWERLTIDQKRRAYAALKTQLSELVADLRYCPHPATWLNQGRFDDSLAPIAQVTGKPKTKDEMTADELRAYYERGGV